MASTELAGPVIFLHIPKTGGTTLLNILQKAYGPGFFDNNRARRQGSPVYPDLDPAAKAEVTLIKGHIQFGFHKHAPDPDAAVYFTFLRDPVDRVESMYRHILRVTEHPLHEKVTALSLREFALGNLPKDIDNSHVRYTCGGRIDYGAVSDEHLEKAKKNIEERFVYVGLMDNFDASLIELARRLGWEKVPQYARRNVAPVKEETLDPELDAEIRERNRYDVQLRAWAAERFGLSVTP